MIAERLKLLRSVLKLTQQDMSVVLKTTQANYSMREKGSFDLKPSELKALRDRYGVNLNWLICGDGEMFDDTPLNKINQKLDRLIKLKGR